MARVCTAQRERQITVGWKKIRNPILKARQPGMSLKLESSAHCEEGILRRIKSQRQQGLRERPARLFHDTSAKRAMRFKSPPQQTTTCKTRLAGWLAGLGRNSPRQPASSQGNQAQEPKAVVVVVGWFRLESHGQLESESLAVPASILALQSRIETENQKRIPENVQLRRAKFFGDYLKSLKKICRASSAS